MEKRKIGMTLGAMSLVLALAAGGVMSFFTDRDEKINKFTVGKVDISLTEPEWEKKADENKNGIPDEAEAMVPGQEVVKDPMITNVGKNDCYIFATVEVPSGDLITVQDNGMRNEKKMTQLYTYQAGEKWKPMGSCKIVDEKGIERGIRYLYAYADEKGICRKVAPGEKTEQIFNKVKMANIMEGQGLDEETFMIDIDAYGIQTENIADGSADMNKIWSIMANQKAIKEQYK